MTKSTNSIVRTGAGTENGISRSCGCWTGEERCGEDGYTDHGLTSAWSLGLPKRLLLILSVPP